MLFAVAVMPLPSDAHSQTYDELSAMVTGPWHHVPDARSTVEFNREMAKCQVVSAQTPVNSTTPAVVARVRWTVVVNCLKASGYEPGAQPARGGVPKKGQAAASVNVAGKGPGISPCSQYTASRDDEKEEHVFYSWAEGFLTGYNMKAKSADMVELSALTAAQQLQFLRGYCDQNPDKKFVEAVLALVQALRTRAANK